MAKPIEETPILKGKEAERFLNILANVDNIELTKNELKIKDMLKELNDELKIEKVKQK